MEITKEFVVRVGLDKAFVGVPSAGGNGSGGTGMEAVDWIVGPRRDARGGGWPLGLLLAATVLIRLIHIGQPIVENYVGRQIPTAMVARISIEVWGCSVLGSTRRRFPTTSWSSRRYTSSGSWP